MEREDIGGDYHRLLEIPQIKDILGEESILFAADVSIQRMLFLKRHRLLLVTDKRVLSIDKKNTMRRSLPYSIIKGLTRSLRVGNYEFIIHVRRSFDEHFIADADTLPTLLNCIKQVHISSLKRNLPIFGVEKSLKDYITKLSDS